MLDSLRDTKTAYLTNGVLKHYSALNENTENDLTIYPNLTKKIRVKFNIEYNGINNASKMCFTNIILDKKQYDFTEKKKDYDKIARIDINLK